MPCEYLTSGPTSGWDLIPVPRTCLLSQHQGEALLQAPWLKSAATTTATVTTTATGLMHRRPELVLIPHPALVPSTPQGHWERSGARRLPGMCHFSCHWEEVESFVSLSGVLVPSTNLIPLQIRFSLQQVKCSSLSCTVILLLCLCYHYSHTSQGGHIQHRA